MGNANFVNVKNYQDGKSGQGPAVNQFRDNFSEVFASKAKGIAYIMISGDGEALASKTFARKEYPKIEELGTVTKIIKLPTSLLDNDETGSITENSGTQYWAKGDPKPKFVGSVEKPKETAPKVDPKTDDPKETDSKASVIIGAIDLLGDLMDLKDDIEDKLD